MRPPKYTSLPDTFWSKVDEPDENGCWNWNAASSHGGYGAFDWEGKIARAPRLAAVDLFGPIRDGLFVLHHCDNPPCVNPSHLWLGTVADNNQDMAQKGRGIRGEHNPAARFNPGDIREMRRLRQQGLPTRGIAERFDVAERHVRRILKREIWSHVE